MACSHLSLSLSLSHLVEVGPVKASKYKENVFTENVADITAHINSKEVHNLFVVWQEIIVTQYLKCPLKIRVKERNSLTKHQIVNCCRNFVPPCFELFRQWRVKFEGSGPESYISSML